MHGSPIIIVGAGRSGTTMLREALASHHDVHATEFEMTALWRYGNARLAHDALLPARDGAEWKKAYIRKRLETEWQQSGKPRLVEKTVSNVLRLAYVHDVLPEAKIIHIVRDGRAVTASAMKRWQAKPEASYLLRKVAGTVPLRDLPWTAAQFVRNRLGFLSGKEARPKSWGPKWPGMEQEIAAMPLAGVCARQWQVSVETALAQAAELPQDCYLQVKYEDVTSNPREAFARIAVFAGLAPDCPSFTAHVAANIHAESQSRWKKDLDSAEQEQVGNLLSTTLGNLGYDV